MLKKSILIAKMVVFNLGWPVQNLYGFLIFDLKGYDMSENERRGERSQERTSSPVRLIIESVRSGNVRRSHEILGMATQFLSPVLQRRDE